MSKPLKTFQEYCLYFTTNTLSRHINKLADEAFRSTGLAPSYAHLILLILDEPGLSQNELSLRINVQASTMTRFIDKLKSIKLVDRTQEGRNSYIFPTEEARDIKPALEKALNKLYISYSEILGEDFAKKITADIHIANIKLNEIA